MSTAQAKKLNLKAATALNHSEAARQLGVTPPTIARWVEEGKLEPVETVLSGYGRYVTAASVRAVKAQRQAAEVAR
jgi:excisionase family DNA binding protein